MNRTLAFLVAAASLGLVALVVKLPTAAPQPPPAPPPAVVVQPPAPTPAPAPAPVSSPGSLSLSGRLSHPYLATGQSDVFLSVDVTAVDVPGSKRAPVNLALVIDRSGSMSGEKIVHARQAALALVDQLDEHDRLSIVHYGNDTVTFAGQFATEDQKQRMRRFIRNIVDEGGTNIGDGLMAGKAQLDKGRHDFTVNRLLLLSDGQPTVGLTSPRALANLSQRLHNDGTTVTAIGVGVDFNEDLMQRIAEVGGGSYGYFERGTALADVFKRDLQQAGTTVARNVKLSFTLPDGMRFGEVLGREFQVSGNVVTVALPDFAARQQEKLVVRVLADARGAAALQTLDVAALKLDYSDLLTSRDASADLRLAALVTDDVKLVQARRDKAAVVDATRARSAVNTRRAAEMMNKGDFGGAGRLLKQNESFFDDDLVRGEATIEEDRKQNDVFFGLSQQPAAPREVQQGGVKAMKVQSMRGSGYGASAY